jgi:CheY-like chemotaxis protein
VPSTPQTAPDYADWTRDALAHLFDQAFLLRHLGRLPPGGPAYADGASLQRALLKAVDRLRPPADVPARSAAWRLYNLLSLRYLEGLSQAEAASELNIGLRHFKREQQRAVESVASLLFGSVPMPSAGDSPGRSDEASEHIAGIDADGGNSGARAVDSVNIEEMLRSTLDVLDPVLAQRDLRARVALRTPLPPVKADPMVARQLLISALGWVMHGARQIELAIEVAQAGSRVVVRLARPSAAESAGPADCATLENVRRLAARARVDVLSQRSARGESVLELGFPASQARCVMVIDDNPDVILLVTRYLRHSETFFAAGFTRPDEALRHLASLKPACILLDLMMPDHDGWEVLRLLKTHPDAATVPVVVSSVLQERELALALGASGVLQFPFSADQLTMELTAVLPCQAPPPPPPGQAL